MHNEEIQSNEVEALKAIYAADFEELENKSAWNQKASPKFMVKLRPSTEFKCCTIEIHLVITMTQTYPKSLPNIEFVKANSLSGRQLETLKQIVDRTVKNLKGSEMIFEVTSNIQSQIDEWAHFVSEAAPNLEEDRLRRLRKEETEQQEKQDKIQRETEAAAFQEEQQYNSLVKEELQKFKETNSPRVDGPSSSLVVPESTLGVTTFKRSLVVPATFKKRPAVFRQVMTGIKVNQPFFGTSYIAKALIPDSEDSPSSESAADIAMLLTRIELRSKFWHTTEGARTLHDLSNELNLIRQFSFHGVVPLTDFSIEQQSGPYHNWEIVLVNPLTRLMTIGDMLNSIETIGFKTAQLWSIQILETLETLHKAGLRHKMLCPDALVLSVNSDTGESRVLLKYPQYFSTLIHLNSCHAFNDDSRTYDWLEELRQWIPPEGRISKFASTVSSKWDIWQFGAIITFMLAGKRALDEYKGDPEAFVRSTLKQWPSVLTSFLLSALNPDPSRRPGALELMTHNFLRTDFDLYNFCGGPMADIDLLSSNNSSSYMQTANSNKYHSASRSSASVAETNATGSFGGRRRLSNNDEHAMSRYKQDFDEGIVLGRGGFGQVVKARNKLDGRVYAIKKIKATPQKLSHILQEVVLLSRLNHQYVVRYYTVWLEDESEQIEPATLQNLSPDTESRRPIEHDSLPQDFHSLLMRHNGSADNVIESLPSSSISLSQFSYVRSLSELDIPSASHDLMSDSGFIEFGYSNSGNENKSLESDQNQLEYDISSENNEREGARPQKLREGLLERLSRVVSKTLYIQMEYCENHTLADLIKQGLHKNPHEYWRLLRQILEALAYIHSEGVIHRDLKPKNIFIDQARNIKIGDFGLARSMVQPLQLRDSSAEVTTNIQPVISDNTISGDSADQNNASNGVVDAEDLTTDIGTSLYAAVEISKCDSKKGGYNEKVDIFSLGIIFFEMVWGFDTEMERIQSIKKARCPQIELPAAMTSSKHLSVQIELIRSMLNHDNRRRPSALGILKSGKLSVEEQKMTVQEAMSNVRDPRIAQQLATALFSRPLISARQVLYDRINASSTVTRRQQPRVGELSGCLTMTHVLSTLTSVFKAHGAVNNTSLRSRIFPRSAIYKVPTVVDVMDTQSTVLQLPHDLTLPYARRLAEIIPEYSKAYAVDTVYRNRLQNPGQHPAKHIEVDFDITTTSDKDEDIIYDDAETLAVMYDSVNALFENTLKETSNSLLIVIGHHDIMSATLSYCGLIPPQYYAALSFLFAGMTGNRDQALARSNISSVSLDMLNGFSFREEISRAKSRMCQLMPLSERIKRAFAHIYAISETLLKLCASQNTPKIVFSPLIHTPTSDFYIGGIIFQLVDIRNPNSSSYQHFGNGSILAVGGRYDSLIKSFRNSFLDSRTQLARSVGFGLSADKLELMLSKGLQQAQSSPISPRCQVLISSLSELNLKTQGLEAVKLLWSVGIAADIVRESMTMDSLMALAQRENVRIVIIVKQVNSMHNASKTFKLLRAKVLGNGSQVQSDVDLAFNELLPFVQSELGLKNLANDEALSQPDNARSSDIEISGDRVLVINESGKLKGGRKNKWQLEERSREARTQFLSELGNVPIISLDLRDDILEAITTVSPHAIEEWKRRVVGLSPNQKGYIMTVQSKLSTEALRSSKMLLYSSKSENIFIYTY